MHGIQHAAAILSCIIYNSSKDNSIQSNLQGTYRDCLCNDEAGLKIASELLKETSIIQAKDQPANCVGDTFCPCPRGGVLLQTLQPSDLQNYTKKRDR